CRDVAAEEAEEAEEAVVLALPAVPALAPGPRRVRRQVPRQPHRQAHPRRLRRRPTLPRNSRRLRRRKALADSAAARTSRRTSCPRLPLTKRIASTGTRRSFFHRTTRAFSTRAAIGCLD